MPDQELKGRQNILHYSPGEIIFKEGHTSTSFYVVKSGRVVISVIRDGRSITLQELGPGDIFGEMAAMTGANRTATATAVSYTECYTYTKEYLEKLLASSPLAIQKMLKVQLDRINEANERASAVVSQAHPLVIAAEIVDLHCRANGFLRDARPGVVMVPYDGVVTSLCRMMGLSRQRAGELLKRMAKFQFFALAGNKEEKRLEISNRNCVEQAQKLAMEVGYDIAGHYESEQEFIDLDALIGFTGAARDNILRKLSTEEFAETMFVFRRSEVVELLNTRGKEFFTRRTIKPIEDWCEIEDLQFVDTPTLQKALGRLEPYDLTVLMLGVPDGEAQDRLDSTLSDRRRAMISELAEAVDNFSDIDVQLILDDLFNHIRTLKNIPASSEVPPQPTTH